MTIAVVPVSDPGTDERCLRWVAERFKHCILVPLTEPADAARRWISSPAGRVVVAATQPLSRRAKLARPDTVLRETGGAAFDVVWTMRLYLAGVALLYRNRAARMVLDIDEDDAATMRAIAELHCHRGEIDVACRSVVEAGAYARLAAHCLGWFDQIVTASDLESEALRLHHRLGVVTTMANAVDARVSPKRRAHDNKPPLLLFVGNLDYVPNLDAAERLAVSVLPAFRRRFPAAELHLAGAGKAAARLVRLSGIHVHGFVADLGPLYDRVHVTVVPLRAGCGSRLKILEAFAYGLPVVATPVAADGLNVSNGDQMLIADDDAELVVPALRIATDVNLSGRLAASKERFVAENHDAEAIAARIADLAHGPGAIGEPVC